MDLADAQRLMREIYGERDRRRGAPLTAVHLVEEVGELFEAVGRGNLGDLRDEAADVLAWLLSLSDLLGIDLNSAFVERYGSGCPKCGRTPCSCPPLPQGRWSPWKSDS